MPTKGARMPPCSVAKCRLLIFYAIIYYCHHSKHINDRLRCAQDNGATCLKLQNRFLFWRPQTLHDVHARAQTHARFSPRLKCKQRRSVTELICPLLIHAIWTGARACLSIFPATFLPLALCQSFHRALAMIKDSFVTPSEASRRQKTSKPAPTEQLTKREEVDWHRRDVCKSLNACECVCDKQMNKLAQPEREGRMTLSLPSARRWKVGRCPSEVRFCTDLKEEGRAWIRAAV